MGMVITDAVSQLEALMEQVEDEAVRSTFQNVHQGYPAHTLLRFLRARDWNVDDAHKMLLQSLQWRLQNQIDSILSKPIIPVEVYRAVRDSQLIGLSGYSKDGLPVFAIGVGLSALNKASVHYYVQSHIQINEYRDRIILPLATKRFGSHIGTCIKVLDMTGLRLSALSQIKLLTIIASIDDLNYPEKTNTYYIVNAPYVFSACWKVVKPLLQERTRKKVQVLSGCGREQLLKVMDYESLPQFCRKERCNGCYSLDDPFHQQMYSYMKQQGLAEEDCAPVKQGSFHVDFPEASVEEAEIIGSIESEFERLGTKNGCSDC